MERVAQNPKKTIVAVTVPFQVARDFNAFQHRHAYEKIRTLAGKYEHLVVVIFVHGWRNNAHSQNVVSFNEFLRQLSTFSDESGVKHRVHGIYVSWRGGCLKHALEQDEVFQRVTAQFGGQPIVDLEQAGMWGSWIAGHSSRVVATRKVVGGIEDGRPQPDPSPDTPPSRAWYIESTKTADALPQSCSFIEFDERGDYLDFCQVRAKEPMNEPTRT